MNKVIAKARGTTGVEYIAGILRRYRVVAMIYVAAYATAFIVNIWSLPQNLSVNNLPPVGWILLILSFSGLLLPVGIILAVFFKDKIKIIKYMLIAGFAVNFIGAAIDLPNRINTARILLGGILSAIFSNIKLYPNSTLQIFMFFIRSVSEIIVFGVTVLFLLILIFNIKSKQTGMVLFVLVVISSVMFLTSFIYGYIDAINYFDSSQTQIFTDASGEIQQELSLLYIMFIRSVYFLTTLSWYAVQFFIAWHLIKPGKSEDI